jgi:sulfur carrier protein ThiS
MTHYAWTIKARGRPDIRKVTTLAELLDILQVLNLPGLAPPDWVIMEVDGDVASHGHFVHSEGSKDEWSLTWTKLDEAERE